MDINDPNQVDESLKRLKDILATANELEDTRTGALVATSGGCFVLGLVLGNIFWLPFAMIFALLLFRLFKYHSEREQRRIQHQLNLIDVVAVKKESIWNSNLPHNEKEYISGRLNQLLSEGIPLEIQRLPPASEDKQNLLPLTKPENTSTPDRADSLKDRI